MEEGKGEWQTWASLTWWGGGVSWVYVELLYIKFWPVPIDMKKIWSLESALTVAVCVVGFLESFKSLMQNDIFMLAIPLCIAGRCNFSLSHTNISRAHRNPRIITTALFFAVSRNSILWFGKLIRSSALDHWKMCVSDIHSIVSIY